jgi:hypothetical protein
LNHLEDLSTGTLIEYQISIARHYMTVRQGNIRIASGTTGFQAQALVNMLSDIPVPGSIPFVVSGNIDRYKITPWNVRYMHHTFRQAYIVKGEEIADQKWDFWLRPKLVIAGMTKEIEACYVSTPLALGVGVYAVFDFGPFDPEFLEGIFNSRFLTFQLRQIFSDKHLAGGYLAINKSTIEGLPLVLVPKTEQLTIGNYAREVRTMLEGNPHADVTALEAEIDRLVYRLYGLTTEEIKIVEGAG